MKYIGLEWWVEIRFPKGSDGAREHGLRWGKYEGAKSRIDAAFICAFERDVQRKDKRVHRAYFRSAGYRGRKRIVTCRDSYKLV